MRNTNTGGSRRQKWLNTYRALSTFMLVALMVMGVVVLDKLSDLSDSAPVPTATEIAEAVNGPAEFQRPSALEYVPETNSCVVGGTVTSAEWHVGGKAVSVWSVEPDTVDYTAFEFESDDGRVFTVSANGELDPEPGENLGLELLCDPTTMNSDESFGLVAIIYGGK
jgi:hypothetical protein